MRRLLAQVGLATLALTLSMGAAMADSSTPGSAATSENGSTVDYSGSGSVQVDVQQNSQQTVGDDTTSSDASATVNVAGPDNSVTPSISTPGPLDDGGVLASPKTETNQKSGPDQIGNTPSEAKTPVSSAQSAIVKSAVLAVTKTIASGVAPTLALVPVPAAAVPHQSNPPLPQNPVGLLGELQTLLASVMVPLTTLLGALPAILPGLLSLALILLALATGAFSGNLYTARLRRSGFLGAPRSDVGGATLSFATPRKMGFISSA